MNEYYRTAFSYYITLAYEYASLDDVMFEKIYHMKAKQALERMCGIYE